MYSLYKNKLLQKLNKKTKIISVFNTDIITKGLIENKKSGIDKREYELALSILEKRKQTKVDLESLRLETGFSSLNLNTKEIITKCYKIKHDGIDFDLWSYYLRKPINNNPKKVLVYVHGGSFFAGTIYDQENLLKLIAEKANIKVFNIDIFLAPEHKYPSQIYQIKTVIEFLVKNQRELNIDINNIYLGGDSAGGNLVLSAYQIIKDIKIKSFILYYPAVSLSNNNPFAWKEEDFNIPLREREYILPRLGLGRSDNKGNVALMSLMYKMYFDEKTKDYNNPLISPLFYDLKKYPKMLIFGAEYDGLRIQYEYFVSKLKENSVDVKYIRYQGLHHGYNNKLGYFPQVEDSVNEIVNYLK